MEYNFIVSVTVSGSTLSYERISGFVKVRQFDIWYKKDDKGYIGYWVFYDVHLVLLKS